MFTDGQYETPHEKIWLSLRSAMVAKSFSVKEHGIGEDLSINILGWRNNKLVVISQLQSSLMKIDPNERLRRVADCAVVLRKGWGVDAFTMMAEGYMSSNPELTRGRSLAVAYAELGSPVSECLTFTHIEEDTLMLVTLPYQQTWGRKVDYGKTYIHENTTCLRDSAYPMMFGDVLEATEPSEIPTDSEEFFETLCLGLEKIGFFTTYSGE